MGADFAGGAGWSASSTPVPSNVRLLGQHNYAARATLIEAALPGHQLEAA